MSAAISRSWRTWGYVLLTYVGAARLSRIARNRMGRLAIEQLQRFLAGGCVRVGGGAAFGLRLSTDHVSFRHRQGFGLLRGVLEPSVQEALRRHVAPGAVVYDVGANIGFFSLLAARLAGPTGRVEAFEPMPSSADAIRANAALNQLDTIRVHQVGVGDRSGPQTLLVHSEDSESHLADRGWHRAITGELTVDVTVLDEQIEQGVLPIPDLIKIDVEGSEMAVIRGLQRTLRLHDVKIVCELHETNHEVAQLLTDLGYAFHNLDGTAPVEDAGPVHLLAHRARHQSTPQ